MKNENEDSSSLGRKPLDIEKKKSVCVKTYLTPEEHKQLVSQVKKTTLTTSQFVHTLIVQLDSDRFQIEKDSQEVAKDFLIQLRAVGSNINQVTRKLNQTSSMSLSEKVQLELSIQEVRRLAANIEKVLFS